MALTGTTTGGFSSLINVQSTLSVRALNIVFWIFFAIALLITLFRLFIRWRKNGSLKWDDYFQVFALALLLVQTVCCTLAWPLLFEMMAINDGTTPFTIAFALRTEKWLTVNFVAVICYFCCLWSVKMSFMFFFKPLLRNKPGLIRYWWSVLIFCCVLVVASNFMFIFLCGNPNRYLHPIFQQGCTTQADILNDYRVVPTSVGLDMLSDLLVMSIPYPILVQVKLPRKQKVLLTIIFSIALGIVAVSAVRVWKLTEQGEHKFPDPIALNIISEAQSIVAVVLCAVPPLRTLIINRGVATDPQRDIEAQRKQLEDAKKKKKPRFGMPTISLASFEMRAKAKYGSHKTGMFGSQRSGLFRSMVGVKTMPTIEDVDVPSSGTGTQMNTLSSWDTVALEKAGYEVTYESLDGSASNLSPEATMTSTTNSSHDGLHAMRKTNKRSISAQTDASLVASARTHLAFDRKGPTIADRRAKRNSLRDSKASLFDESHADPAVVDRFNEKDERRPSGTENDPFISTFSPPPRTSTPDPLPARKLRLDTISTNPHASGPASANSAASSARGPPSASSDARYSPSHQSGLGSALSMRTPDTNKTLPPLPGGDMSGGRDHFQHPYSPLYSPTTSTSTAHITSQTRPVSRSQSQRSRSTVGKSTSSLSTEPHRPSSRRVRDPAVRRSRSDVSELLKKVEKPKAKSYLVHPQPGINTVLGEDKVIPRPRARSGSATRVIRKYSSPPPHDPSQKHIHVKREIYVAESSDDLSINRLPSRGRSSGANSVMSGDGEAVRQARDEYWARDIQRHEYEQKQHQQKNSSSVSPAAGRFDKYRGASPHVEIPKKKGFGGFGWKDIGARRIINGKLVEEDNPANWHAGAIPAIGMQQEPKVRTWVGKGLSRMSAHDLRSVDEAVEEIWRREKEDLTDQRVMQGKSEEEASYERRIQAEVDRQAQRRAGRGAAVRELSLSRTRAASRARLIIEEKDEPEEDGQKESDQLLADEIPLMDLSEPFSPVTGPPSSKILAGPQKKTNDPVAQSTPADLGNAESSNTKSTRAVESTKERTASHPSTTSPTQPTTKIGKTIHAFQSRAQFRTRGQAKLTEIPARSSSTTNPHTTPPPSSQPPEPIAAGTSPAPRTTTDAGPATSPALRKQRNPPQDILVNRTLSQGAQRLRMEEERRSRGLWSPLQSPVTSSTAISTIATPRDAASISGGPSSPAKRSMSVGRQAAEVAPPVPEVTNEMREKSRERGRQRSVIENTSLRSEAVAGSSSGSGTKAVVTGLRKRAEPKEEVEQNASASVSHSGTNPEAGAKAAEPVKRITIERKAVGVGKGSKEMIRPEGEQ